MKKPFLCFFRVILCVSWAKVLGTERQNGQDVYVAFILSILSKKCQGLERRIQAGLSLSDQDQIC